MAERCKSEERESHGKGNGSSGVSGSDEVAAHTEPKIKTKKRGNTQRQKRKKEMIAIRGDRTLDHTVKSRALYRLS